MSRYYTGPVSDHFDGERFFDRDGVSPKGRSDLLRWLIERNFRGSKAKWPVWAPSPHADRPPRRVDGAAVRIVYVGHASWLIQTAGRNILLDPVWSERVSPVRFAGPKRVNDPGIAFADLPPIDAVLVSHAHYDHLDVATLSQLAAAHRPRVITPLGNDTIMRNHDAGIAAEAYDWHQRAELGAAHLEGAHRFLRVHVHVAHEPARLVGAERQDRQAERSVAVARLAEMRAVAVA